MKKTRLLLLLLPRTIMRSGSIRSNCDVNRYRFPSRTEPKPEDDLPGGYKVLPGKYKMVFQQGKWKDSTIVEVKADPFKPLREVDLLKIMKLAKELNAILGTAGYYIDASWDNPGENAMIAMENARMKTKEVTTKVENWFGSKWAEYRKNVEMMSLNIF